AVIALAFEKHKDRKKGMEVIETYKNTFNIPYEMVYAGYYNKKEAVKKLPMLNHILSYPTMIFLDRENKVRRIHTGFSGPATSKYDEFTKDFDNFVKQLLAEPS
ncbi:MAG: TlpA family protein disulfide reductase, partial [Bacteroidota bacterium]